MTTKKLQKFLFIVITNTLQELTQHPQTRSTIKFKKK